MQLLGRRKGRGVVQQGTHGASKYGALLVPFFLFCLNACYGMGRTAALTALLQKPVRVLSSLEPDFEKALLCPLKQTRGRILALQYSLSNKAVIQELQERASAGVSVEIVLDPSTFSSTRSYEKGKHLVIEGTRGLNSGVCALMKHDRIDVRVYDGGRGLMHCKTFIMQNVATQDGEKDIVHSGSANCTGVGLDGTNCEISHLFSDPDVVKRYLHIYSDIRSNSRSVVFGGKGEEGTKIHNEDKPFSISLSSEKRKGKKRKKKLQTTYTVHLMNSAIVGIKNAKNKKKTNAFGT